MKDKPGIDLQSGCLQRAHSERVNVDRRVWNEVVVSPFGSQDVQVPDVFTASLHVPVNNVWSDGSDLNLQVLKS
jgi:hypothetical protein